MEKGKRPRIKSVAITVIASSSEERFRQIRREGISYFKKVENNGELYNY